MALLVISTAATYAVQPKDEPKETVQTPTDEHLPSLTINGTNESSSFFVDSKALPGKRNNDYCSEWIYCNSNYNTSQLRKTKSNRNPEQY